MFKNLQIKLLKYQKTYLQGKVLLNKAEIAFSRSKKLQLIGLTVVMGLAVGGMYYGNVLAQDKEEGVCEENSMLPCKSAKSEYDDASINTMGASIVKTILAEYEKDTETGEIEFVMENAHKGAMGKVASATGVMYLEGPVSTQQYLAYLGQKANIGPSPTYAQSVQGYQILQPIIKLWEWSRNIVYIFYVIMFLIIGVMIIMRNKIGGQVPMTIINSIPSVIISLVLVTFSYGISGLIIDAMHLATGVVYQGFFQGPNHLMLDTAGQFTFQSPDMSVLQIFGTAGITDFSAGFNLGAVTGMTGGWMVNNIIGMISGVAGNNTLMSVVLSIAGITAMFKIFFTLLTKYLTFMISPAIAPFQFLLGSLPGKSKMIGDWFKGMFSAAGAFVGVYVAFCIMIIITAGGASGASVLTGWSWFPPMTGFSAGLSTIAHMLAYAIFIATPNIPALVEKAFESQGSGLFSGVGQATAQSTAKVPILGDLAKVLG